MGGMIWRNTMPLLSTLAAMVIIVNSLEPEMDTEYRTGVRPRMADVEPRDHGFEQTWRSVELEPMMEPSIQIENRDGAPVDPPRRRKQGRKRKRRPKPNSEEPDERRMYHEDMGPRKGEPVEPIEDNVTTELPRRRRKRPEMQTPDWTASDQEQPMRRRGLRRKRPHPKRRQKLSEFDIFKGDSSAEVIHPVRSAHDLYQYDDDSPIDHIEIKARDHSTREEHESSQIDDNSDDGEGNDKMTQDKSLSDVSLERQPQFEELLSPYDNKIRNFKSQGPLDPVSLKEILRKSNGSSLSEILQQHNLSLADLLHGRQGAAAKEMSELKAEFPNNDTHVHSEEEEEYLRAKLIKQTEKAAEKTNIKMIVGAEAESITETVTLSNDSVEIKANTSMLVNDAFVNTTNIKIATDLETFNANEDAPKVSMRRRIPLAGRRRLRFTSPVKNTTVKFHASRDFPPLNPRLQAMQQNWTSSLKAKQSDQDFNERNSSQIEKTSTTASFESAEKSIQSVSTTPLTSTNDDERAYDSELQSTKMITTETTTTTKMAASTTTEAETEKSVTTTETPVTPIVRQKPVKNLDLQRQALANRLKKKRLKHRNSTVATPQEEVGSDLFGMPNLVSASEFISRTQSPKTTKADSNDVAAIDLEDFMATEASTKIKSENFSPQHSKPTSTTARLPMPSSTEETAHIEIEEILNDTNTGARLSKILKDRNMTLNELFEHRERGSSRVHLADIFHNASSDPNPTEPFLAKSSIEPISRETYPLRALLDANIHDTTARPSSYEPQPQYLNIPVVMDFGNNVNENSENMGIVSMFNKMLNSERNSSPLKKDSDGTPYISSVISVNITNGTDNAREGRDLNASNEMVTLNEIFSLMQQNFKNETHKISTSFTKALDPTGSTTKALLEDLDDDEVIVLEDLQHLKDFDSNIATASDEKLHVTMEEQHSDTTVKPGILNNMPSSAKSVTVATASIAGLMMVLFLLTYTAFKWRQQRCTLRKKESFCEEHIPSPVFESRKGNKNHCSSRSISPMLSSNIYTLSTLDSRNGKESPDYTWDSLRKPFQ